MEARQESLQALAVFHDLCRRVTKKKEVIAFEWPAGIEGWDLPEVQALIHAYKLAAVTFHGCMFGLVTPVGVPMRARPGRLSPTVLSWRIP